MNPDTTTPPWAMQILQTLNSTCGRLQGIEREMKAQNTKWESVDYALKIKAREYQILKSNYMKQKG